MARLHDVVIDIEQAKEAENSSETTKTRFLTSLADFCRRNFLPIGTVFSIIIGIFLPQPAVFLSERIPVVKICVIVLFFTIGLRMRLVEAKSAMESYIEMIIGLILILFIGPMFAINLLNQIPYFGSFIEEAGYQNFGNYSNYSVEEMPILGPEEFRLALQIYLLCPSAPATALVLVSAANGHRGLSILVAILCTVMSVFTIPPMLAWLICSLQHVHIDVPNVLLKTVLKVLLPLVVGRCLRFASPVKKVVKKWNNAVKYIGLTFLILVFLVKVSETRSSGNLEKVSVVNILAVVGLGLSFTTFNFITSYVCFSLLPWFSKQSTVTLAILSSVRVVSFAATITDVLPENAGDKGLLILPMVFVYLSTVLMLNGFVYFVKVKVEDKDEKVEEPGQTVEAIKDHDTKNKDFCENSKINEVAVFSIYTDEMVVKDQNL